MCANNVKLNQGLVVQKLMILLVVCKLKALPFFIAKVPHNFSAKIKELAFIICTGHNGFHDVWSKATWLNVAFRGMLLFIEPDIWLNFHRKKLCVISICLHVNLFNSCSL